MKQARTLTDKQLKVVLASCMMRRHAMRDKTIVLFSFMTGLRAKEIAALTFDNIYSANGAVKDEFLLEKHQTKGSKTRKVFISHKLKRELEDYRNKVEFKKSCNALFQSQKGNFFSANTMCQLFLNIYASAGLDGASSHSGRRTLLTNLAAKGVGVRVLAEVAGHSSINIVQKYIDVSDNQIKHAINLI